MKTLSTHCLKSVPPLGFPSCSHFLLASQFVGWMDSCLWGLDLTQSLEEIDADWLVLYVCVLLGFTLWIGPILVTLDLVVAKLPSQEEEIRNALSTAGQSLKIGMRITPPAQGRWQGLPKPLVLFPPTRGTTSGNCTLQPSSFMDKRGQTLLLAAA